MSKLCQNCIHAEMTESVKNGKYRNFIYKCRLHPQVLILDHWKKTEALNCKDFIESNSHE